MEIPPKLKEYIDNNRGSLPPVTDPDEPLQIDSLGLIRLVAFLENDFGFRIEDEELIADNFATLRTLGELLATKTPTAPSSRNQTPGRGGYSDVFGQTRKRDRSAVPRAAAYAGANKADGFSDAAFCQAGSRPAS